MRFRCCFFEASFQTNTEKVEKVGGKGIVFGIDSKRMVLIGLSRNMVNHVVCYMRGSRDQRPPPPAYEI